MAATISSWYHAQYASWNRTRRLHAAPFLATENTGPAATAARLAATDALLLNMSEVTNLMASSSALQPEAPKKPDTLFGPGVGVISSGPGWTEPTTTCQDELTPEVVKTWMAKSKETTQPTTTLQALVNLKRPTIKLSPVSNPEESTEAIPHQRHALEFEFDCDSPKCSVKVNVIGQSESESMIVFDAVVDGGFGKHLKLSDGAILDLEHFEIKAEPEPQTLQPSGSTDAPVQSPANTEAPATIPSAGAVASRGRRRFSAFPFRKRAGNTERVSGPALQVVDADAPPTSNATAPTDPSKNVQDNKQKEETGVKITIRLEAWDEENRPLASANSQITYLHIVRLGADPPDGEEDKRPWVVKVVRREATIGLHTFHLHEIYGLSSSTSQSLSMSGGDTGHAYPPPATSLDDQTSECLLCLSSPREVVLLPCRHLVACKECAVNMVEFGAGGTLVHTEQEPTPTTPSQPTDPSATGEMSPAPTGGEQSATATTTTPPMPTPRRKRKAKGWYCPVCRQPYTSLLRITATPPEKDMGRDSSSQENLTSPPQPAPTVVATPPASTNATESRGIFARPNFLRSISRPGSRASTTAGANMV